jgi:hypothetical protein
MQKYCEVVFPMCGIPKTMEKTHGINQIVDGEFTSKEQVL